MQVIAGQPFTLVVDHDGVNVSSVVFACHQLSYFNKIVAFVGPAGPVPCPVPASEPGVFTFDVTAKGPGGSSTIVKVPIEITPNAPMPVTNPRVTQP